MITSYSLFAAPARRFELNAMEIILAIPDWATEIVGHTSTATLDIALRGRQLDDTERKIDLIVDRPSVIDDEIHLRIKDNLAAIEQDKISNTAIAKTVIGKLFQSVFQPDMPDAGRIWITGKSKTASAFGTYTHTVQVSPLLDLDGTVPLAPPPIRNVVQPAGWQVQTAKNG